MSSLTIICLEYGLGYTILSAFYFVQAILSIQFSKHLERGTQEGGGGGNEGRTTQHCNIAKKVNEHRFTSRKVDETPSPSHTVRVEITATPQIDILFTASTHQKNHQHRNTANPHVPPSNIRKKILLRHQILPILDRMHLLILTFNYHVP